MAKCKTYSASLFTLKNVVDVKDDVEKVERKPGQCKNNNNGD